MKADCRSKSQAEIWRGRKIRKSPFFCPLIFLPSFRQAGLPRHSPESLRGDGGSHRVAVSRSDFVKGPVKVPRPISEKVKVIHNARTVKTVKWFFAILQMQPAAVQLVPTSVNRIEEKIKKCQKCQNPCNSSKPNKRSVKKVDMKSIVPYFMRRNEYFEPATVVERAAPAPCGGCGLIIRLQEFSNPIADKTGAGVFAFYKHK